MKSLTPQVEENQNKNDNQINFEHPKVLKILTASSVQGSSSGNTISLLCAQKKCSPPVQQANNFIALAQQPNNSKYPAQQANISKPPVQQANRSVPPAQLPNNSKPPALQPNNSIPAAQQPNNSVPPVQQVNNFIALAQQKNNSIAVVQQTNNSIPPGQSTNNLFLLAQQPKGSVPPIAQQISYIQQPNNLVSPAQNQMMPIQLENHSLHPAQRQSMGSDSNMEFFNGSQENMSLLQKIKAFETKNNLTNAEKKKAIISAREYKQNRESVIKKKIIKEKKTQGQFLAQSLNVQNFSMISSVQVSISKRTTKSFQIKSTIACISALFEMLHTLKRLDQKNTSPSAIRSKK